MKQMTNKQTMIVVGSLLLLLAVRAISQMAQEDAASNQAFRPAPQGTVSAPARGFSQDSSDTGIPTQDAEQPMGGTLEQPTNNGLEPGVEVNSDGFGAGEAMPNGQVNGQVNDQTGMDSGGTTQSDQAAQESHDRLTRGFDNLIKDEVTLENPTTGEITQGEAGSSNYYQSPSVDGAAGESTIIGADGAYTPPADATQLNIIGSDSGASSSTTDSSGGSTP
jgi:hypothetical protein